MAMMVNGQTATASPDSARWWGLGEVVRLAIPTVVNTVSYTVMQFVDGLMVSHVSKEALSAQLIGGLTAFTAMCFFMGVLWCVSTFASQNLGAGRPERSALYGWQGLWLALGSAVVLAGLIPLARLLLGLMGHPPEVLDLETRYFQIMIGGAVFSLATSALGSFFVGMHRPMIPLVAGVVANLINFVAALGLIFGLWGLPKLGLMGAAVASVLAMAVQASVLFVFFAVGENAKRYEVWRQERFSARAMIDLLKIGAPAGAMFLADVLMWAIFMGAVIGSFGTEHLAAAAILNRYWHLCFMPALGVSAAVTAIVGRYCGAGRQDLARRRAHAGLILIETYMITCGLVVWLARDTLVTFFNGASVLQAETFPYFKILLAVDDPVVQSIATHAVIFILLCQAFDALSVTFVGALRGAGDTLWPGVVQTVMAYGLGLGGSALVARLMPQWGSLGAWGAASAYIMLLGLVMWGRFLRGKWRRIRVVEPAPAVVLEEPSALPPV